MRHTVHLLLGSALNQVGKELKKYILKYGEGDVKDFLQVVCWQQNVEKSGWNVSMMVEAQRDENEFYSDLEQQFSVVQETAVNVTEEHEVEKCFSSFYTKLLTINQRGDSNAMHLCIHLPLFDDQLAAEYERIVKVLSGLKQQYKVDIMGYSSDMSFLFGIAETKEVRETAVVNLQHLVEIKKQYEQSGLIHRLFLMQNYNADGVSLNLDEASVVRIIGEFTLACVENYDTLFPLSEELEPTEITAFGLSVLCFDKYYFANYLLRRAYLTVLDRERVNEKAVDVNKASEIAQKCLRGRTRLLTDFYMSEVDPLVKSARPHEEIASEIAAKLQTKIDTLISELQSFISDQDLSLPEKQVIIAQLLGLDDELLTGYQFSDDLLTLEDCHQEPIQLFVDEVNRLLSAEYEDEEFNSYFGEDTPLPRNSLTGQIEVPIEDIKRLRQDIMRSTTYIREKTREMEDIENQIEMEVESQKRLSDQGFVYGGTTFKLLTDDEVEIEPLEETYEPQAAVRRDVDLRPFFTPIKSQGSVGACTVFSIVSIYEYILKKSKAEEHDLSERFVYYNVCKTHNDAMDDHGSTTTEVIQSIHTEGVTTENLCPDILRFLDPPSEKAYTDAKKRIIRQAKNVRVEHKSITSALSEGYPVVISLKIYDSFGNNHQGFVYRPTESEIASGKYGYHAMVIVGYSEDYRFYIVRNSWGSDFGDNGYCYIPYNYIEDTTLNRACCIITLINDGIDVRGYDDSGMKFSFSNTDFNLRYAVIRNQVDAEKLELAIKNQAYTEKRLSYENLVQILCKPAVRKCLLGGSEYRLSDCIANMKRQYERRLSERTVELDEFKKTTWKWLLYLSVAILVLGFAWGYCLYKWWLPDEWGYYSGAVLLLCVLFLIFFYPWRKAQYKKLELELEAELEELSRQQAQTSNSLGLQRLKMHVAGMILDSFARLHHNMTNRYLALRSYVGNLSLWRDEEASRLDAMTTRSKDPFILLLANNVLDSYYEENCKELTEDTWLYQYLDSYSLNDETILAYKNRIKQELLERLLKVLDDFTIYNYISGKVKYPYLDNRYSNIDELLPMLDEKSKPFMQYAIREIEHKTPMSRNIFIHTDSQEDAANWRATYPRYFQMTPSSAETVSRFKLAVIQKQDMKLSDLKMVSTG